MEAARAVAPGRRTANLSNDQPRTTSIMNTPAPDPSPTPSSTPSPPASPLPASPAPAATPNPALKLNRGADKQRNRAIGHFLKHASHHRPSAIRSMSHSRGR
jgi:hypothetical protein